MKKIKLILFGLVFILVLVGCGQTQKDYNGGIDSDDATEDSGEKVEQQNVLTSQNRKIIYTVNAHISTDDLDKTVASIKHSLTNDEWFDNEYYANETAYLTIRVKSSRLNEFVDTFSNYGKVGNFSKEAKDISLSYQSYENRIASLEAELERLNALYKEATIQEMITINQRASQINLEIGELTGRLNQYNSLTDYSVVKLTIYDAPLKEEPSFRSSILKAFKDGWHAVVAVLKFFVIALSAILPFAVIILPVGGIVYFATRKKKGKE